MEKIIGIFFLMLACSQASYILPDSSVILRHCLGPACPGISLPILKEDGSNATVDCESGKNRVVPDPSNCQSYYACRNGTGVKYTCTLGYAFHPRVKLCVPETLVKSCGRVYCPPTILVGVIPDPKNCTRFYRCIYSIPVHLQCEPGSVYDEEVGKCKNFGDQTPECLAKEEDNSSNNATTTISPPEISSTTPIVTDQNLSSTEGVTTTNSVIEESSSTLQSSTVETPSSTEAPEHTGE